MRQKIRKRSFLDNIKAYIYKARERTAVESKAATHQFLLHAQSAVCSNASTASPFVFTPLYYMHIYNTHTHIYKYICTLYIYYIRDTHVGEFTHKPDAHTILPKYMFYSHSFSFRITTLYSCNIGMLQGVSRFTLAPGIFSNHILHLFKWFWFLEFLSRHRYVLYCIHAVFSNAFFSIYEISVNNGCRIDSVCQNEKKVNFSTYIFYTWTYILLQKPNNLIINKMKK